MFHQAATYLATNIYIMAFAVIVGLASGLIPFLRWAFRFSHSWFHASFLVAWRRSKRRALKEALPAAQDPIILISLLGIRAMWLLMQIVPIFYLITSASYLASMDMKEADSIFDMPKLNPINIMTMLMIIVAHVAVYFSLVRPIGFLVRVIRWRRHILRRRRRLVGRRVMQEFTFRAEPLAIASTKR